MSKKSVPLVSGERYHVYNRGVDKRDIFLEKHDYLRFYQSLLFFNTIEATGSFRLAKSLSDKNITKLVQIYSYCLLPNHFHLILEQMVDGGISEFMKRISVGYTGYFNEKYTRTGVLFQGGFKRVHIENETQFQYLVAYVNENHTVHQINNSKEIFNTSSLHFIGVSKSKMLNEIEVNYDQFEARKLALEIYNKRQSQKDLIDD